VAAVSTPLVLVSNEIGMGIVPEPSLGRQFRDEQGRLDQAIAAFATGLNLLRPGCR
jgi:adenosylcobinamide kinase/adenosylcobinamide-phosphate guanylyltransferase